MYSVTYPFIWDENKIQPIESVSASIKIQSFWMQKTDWNNIKQENYVDSVQF